MELADKVTLLHQEALKGNETAVRTLLEDVKADARLTEGGVTAFYRAAASDHRKIMHVLLLAGAQVNANVSDPLMDLDGAPYDLLRYAIRSGNVTALENLLAVNANLNSISAKWRYTPLHDAVEKCRYNITRILLENELNPNADSENGPALSIAARQGNMEMIMLLLKYGADVDGGGTKKPPLIEAVAAGKQDTAFQLIEQGANLNASSESGDNVVHIAAKNGSSKIIKYLIKKGLVNQKNRVGRTPLHVVQHNDTAHILLKGGALVNAVTNKGETPLHYATYSGNYEIAELLIKHGARIDLLSNETYGMKLPFVELKQFSRLFRNNGKNSKGFTALAIAIWKKNNRLITFLIDKKSPLNLEGLEWPPLHMAVWSGEVRAMRGLLEAGADVDVQDNIGWTSLHKAVLKNTVEGVDFLIRLGAQLDAKDQYGRTPLHLAAAFGMPEIAKFLIGSSADANEVDTVSFNALLWAVAGGHPYFLRLTIDSVSDMESTERYEYLRKSAKEDIEAILNLTLEYKQYMHRFDEEVLRDFLNKAIPDIHINITDIGRRLREYANDKDRPLTVDSIRTVIENVFQDSRKTNLEMIGFIANKTHDLNTQDSIMGWSALHWAAAAGDLDAVKFLVGKEAFINTESKLRHTPMFLARRWGHKDLYQFFKESGAIW
nr:ankyrin-3-like [Halyomorpha halys]